MQCVPVQHSSDQAAMHGGLAYMLFLIFVTYCVCPYCFYPPNPLSLQNNIVEHWSTQTVWSAALVDAEC